MVEMNLEEELPPENVDNVQKVWCWSDAAAVMA